MHLAIEKIDRCKLGSNRIKQIVCGEIAGMASCPAPLKQSRSNAQEDPFGYKNAIRYFEFN
jgi:hypothetical protein